MQEIANRELTDEQREAFEKEIRLQTQERYRAQMEGRPKQRKSKGEKKRAKRDQRKYGYS